MCSETIYNGFKNTSLHYATEKGYIEVVKLLLQNGADVNAFNLKSKTPLHLAAERGFLEVTKLLLQNGADVNAKSSNFANTPLILAAMKGHFEIVKLLLENGANVNQMSYHGSHGSDSLGYAAYYGHLEIVKILLKHGAYIPLRDRFIRHLEEKKYQKILALLKKCESCLLYR